jgi:Family of unknown function (DUF5343)
MALSDVYVQSLSRFSAFFQQIRDAQAPGIFSQQLLKDWGYSSSNDRNFIPLLKALGFLSQDGKPTHRYLDYRDHSKSRRVLGDGIREAYSDIFLIKAKPTESDKDAIKGKFKSSHNTSDNVAGLLSSTFLKLLDMADIDTSSATPISPEVVPSIPAHGNSGNHSNGSVGISGLHYNIQIHLPPTKDIEIYNAIFKSLKEHLFEG